jgi:hypothetical protein
MRCKPNELAFIAKTHPDWIEYIGRVVTTVSLGVGKYAGQWLTDLKVAGHDGDVYCPDANLSPIRPGDISDEEVRDLYAPKVTEAA